MSTTIQPRTLTVVVLDVDGTLTHQDHQVHDDATAQAAIRAAIGKNTTTLRKVGSLYDMDVWAAAHTGPDEAPANIPANCFVAIQGDLETLAMGRVAFVTTDPDGQYVSPSTMQFGSLSTLAKKWKLLKESPQQEA
ncbi:hypothetical protein [Luteococcus sp.]|uniref:hypothetical protein n=1 Tax=Luteococcus sp. TaxID=1969402 RepID=UPI003736BC5B